MTHKIDICRAVKVDPVQLTARLEAYVTTRDAIQSFKDRMEHCNFPEEMTDMITDEVKDLAYENYIDKWNQRKRCSDGHCDIRSHFSVQELHDQYRIGCINGKDVTDDSDPGPMREESQVRHQDTVENYLSATSQQIENVEGASFVKCIKVESSFVSRKNTSELTCLRQIFTEDFGLDPRFVVLPLYSNDDPEDSVPQKIDVSAYLAMPLTSAAMLTLERYNKSKFVIEQSLSTSRIQDTNYELVHLQFRCAIKALRLESPHIWKEKGEEEVECNCKSRVGETGTDGNTMDINGEEPVKANGPCTRDETEDNKHAGNTSSETLGIVHKNSRVAHNSGESNKDSVSYEKTKIRVCVTCGSTECQSELFQIGDHEIMVLASGELLAHDDDQSEDTWSEREFF